MATTATRLPIIQAALRTDECPKLACLFDDRGEKSLGSAARPRGAWEEVAVDVSSSQRVAEPPSRS